MTWKPELRVAGVGVAAIIAADGLTKMPVLNFLFDVWYLEMLIAIGIIFAVEKYLK